MFTTIALLLVVGLFILLALAALGFLFQLLNTAGPLLEHMLAALLASRATTQFVTDLHNGYTLKPATFQHAIDILTHRLTDMLLMNGFSIRDWNPRILVESIIGQPQHLNRLTKAIDHARDTLQCQDSISTPQSTHTPQYPYTAN